MPYTGSRAPDRIFALGPGQPESLAAGLKAQVYAVDPAQPVMDMKPMETVLAENAYARPRFNLLLFASVRGFRAGAGAVRDLWRDLAGGFAADARNRHTDRVGRAVRRR